MYQTVLQYFLSTHHFKMDQFDENFLNSIIQKRIIATHSTTQNKYYQLLLEDESESLILIDALQIHYSEFFRNPLTFAVLEKLILPSILFEKKRKNKNEIRIWSAACAAGQEAYSLAILLEELMEINNSKIKYKVFATDYAEAQIQIAEAGRYQEEFIQNISLNRIKKWFSNNNIIYQVNPELKQNIHFGIFDLFNPQLSCPPESIFGDFDIVVCANIFYYLNPEHKRKVLDKITNVLTAGGYLVTGETEREMMLQNGYKEICTNTSVFELP